ncbi:MAG TPA: glycoside hydrolase family 88 protein [Pyrinomonadaceae bacterium]|nr:glycoside hydrolase family 88 protein [Pyrinomonadaceae bacterium]
MRFRFLFVLLVLVVCGQVAVSQERLLSAEMAETAMNRLWTDSPNGAGIPPKWVYDYGVVLNGMKALWQTTGDKRYYDFIKRGVDAFVNPDGTIKTYSVDEYNLDQVRMGSAVLMMYRVTGDAKYKKAADLIRSQLKAQPRTNEGGFWHKKIYPYQMWLDGLYMAEPFYAEYSAVFGENNWDDIANQFIWMEKHVRDDKTGLLYHAWDESKQQKWADKQTGRAPMFWGRAMGWYAMALVDVLDYFPKDHPKRGELIAILNREMSAIQKVQDKQTGVWWLILDMPGKEKNYLEASASAMFTYALGKGIRMGYLPASFTKTANIAWAGMQKQFLEAKDNSVNFVKTIGGAGLGGNPYRSGDYDYYVNEKVVTNDPKGIGAFMLAATEMESAPLGAGKTVVLDDYFNHETKKDDSGRMVAWHYKWDELDNGGYSLLGDIFNRLGVRTETLSVAPTAENLKGADIYVIVDPDDEKESPKPNFIEQPHIKAISDWVKSGGVLVLMGNDFGNCEFDHFNNLAKEFGIQFNKDSVNHVEGNQFEQGRILIDANNPIFGNLKKVYLKEISTLSLVPPARSIQDWNGNHVMAVAKFGKGTVFAVGDPWIYNEYTDGRKLPADFENFKAAKDLTRWLLEQTRGK